MKKSVVYFQPVTQANDSVALQAHFKHLIKKSGLCEKFSAGELVAIKTHMGEQGNKYHVHPRVIKAVVDKIKSHAAKPFVTDTNVIYNGRRRNAVDHSMLAHEHGFRIETLGCPVIIADGVFGENSEDVGISQRHCAGANVVRMLRYLNSLVVVSHVTGHILTGMAAAIKNVGMGLASRAGKYRQHAGVKPSINRKQCVLCGRCLSHCPTSAISEQQGAVAIDEQRCIGCAECVTACAYGAVRVDFSQQVEAVVEKNAEYALAVLHGVRTAIFFNFAVHITPDCDCMASKDSFLTPDIGILASVDPVACDTASADMIAAVSRNSDIFRTKGYPQAASYLHQLRYAQHIGLGSMEYELITVA